MRPTSRPHWRAGPGTCAGERANAPCHERGRSDDYKVRSNHETQGSSAVPCSQVHPTPLCDDHGPEKGSDTSACCPRSWSAPMRPINVVHSPDACGQRVCNTTGTGGSSRHLPCPDVRTNPSHLRDRPWVLPQA